MNLKVFDIEVQRVKQESRRTMSRMQLLRRVLRFTQAILNFGVLELQSLNLRFLARVVGYGRLVESEDGSDKTMEHWIKRQQRTDFQETSGIACRVVRRIDLDVDQGDLS